MDAKKDIYNSWIQYTTKNDETYFRQFISGFVQIWKNQLELDFENFPKWNDIQADAGPNLSRLPDELLPAIAKFIIIARDQIERGEFSNDKLQETAVLINCLIIICRHFDNIPTIIKYEYKANLIAILNKIFQSISKIKSINLEETNMFVVFSQLLEVIYDPYFTWRNYLKGLFADYKLLSYKAHPVHVEIVPFIYDCFQNDDIFNYNEIGTALINALGSIIAGSQRNGMRAICPATVSVIIKLISKWECPKELRKAALKCCTLMIIVLQRSSPEERQIELVTIIQMYCDAILELLKTQHFLRISNPENTFEISNDDTNETTPVDVQALESTVSNVIEFLAESTSRCQICYAITETNLIDTLISMPFHIKNWKINNQLISYYMIKVLAALTKISTKIADNLIIGQKFDKVFKGISELGKPTEKLLEVCFELAFDNATKRLILPEVVLKLIKWLPDINEKEQNFLTDIILKGCASNYLCKSLACEKHLTQAICECLGHFNELSEISIQNLIKLIEELSKLSIIPIELKRIMWLLREQTKFPQAKRLLQTLVTVSWQNTNNSNICSQYLDIKNPEDGIIVQDIKNWTLSGSYGFIFHSLLRLDKLNNDEYSDAANKNYRRMLFKLMTLNDTGFEVFIQHTGNLVVAAITRREYLTSSVMSKTLLDGRWHFVTIVITPPKRPFSYSQINIYVDFMQKLSTTLKVQAINEPFHLCTIGSAFQSSQFTEKKSEDRLTRSTSHETTSRGMFPSILERTLSAHVSNYFTLPLRNNTSFDPNVKNFPIGMQDNVFGEQICLKGQMSSVLMADPMTNLKTIFDAGINFASIFSQDTEALDLSARFVFCYSAASYNNGICPDLVPGGKFNGTANVQHCQIVKIQDTINSVGGLQAILPILHSLAKQRDDEFSLSSSNGGSENISQSNSFENLKTPTMEEFSDWEVLPSSTSSYAEWKMIQHPVASFICFLRFLTHDHEKNQENLLNTECLPIVGLMLAQCDPKLFDVHGLMAIHLFIESMQNQKPANLELLDSLYVEIVFNFEIWSKMQFQITLGHIQYLSTMVKNDRKYYRKKFGIQYILDTIRQYYATPENITLDDAKTIRSTLLSILRFYLQKDVSIKEVGHIIAFIASVKYEHILIELFEMLISYLKTKSCKDQMILLLHEPQTANLLYNIFIDKIYSDKMQEAAIRLIDCLLQTSRVQSKYKQILRLQDATWDNQSLYPGLFSYLTPFTLSSTVISILINQILCTETDYSGLLFLVHHMSLCNITQKVEIAKKLLHTTFVKQLAPQSIAKQIGWQESISRLLIRKPMTNMKTDDDADDANNRSKSFGINLTDVLLEDNSEYLAQSDLINFCEQAIESAAADTHEERDSSVILNEIQASVTEAANVIENEIKELAGTVTDAVAENVANVFSVIRQRTSEIQDTFEHLASGGSIDIETLSAISHRTRTASNSSDEQSSTQSALTISKGKGSLDINPDSSPDEEYVNAEEQLVFLVTNVLFTVLWRGISNETPNCWKERGQVLACINLLGLNNELVASHLTLKLKILELGVEASLSDLTEHGSQTLINQENASQLLRMVYDLVVLGSNEDESKKCSTKLLDDVLALLDCLMIFQQTASDDWADMIRLCLGLLLKCSHHPNPGVVAMATAKLHAILQSRISEEPTEMAYLLYSINKALDSAIEVGNPEQYSFLMPVMKALLDKCRNVFNLDATLPDLPPTSSGPIFFNDFQMYSTSKKWKNFIEKMIKPLFDTYQKEVETTLWEPINRFWAECYEGCKTASKKRTILQGESRKHFQQKITMPWKVRQVEEVARLNSTAVQINTKNNLIKRKWKSAKRFLYGQRGPWNTGWLQIYDLLYQDVL